MSTIWAQELRKLWIWFHRFRISLFRMPPSLLCPLFQRAFTVRGFLCSSLRFLFKFQERLESSNSDIVPSRELCPYAKCYCEENVWKLCELIKDKGENLLERYSVVFISNEAKTVPLWKQKASSQGQDMDYLVIWDYHVILLESQPQSDTEEDKTSGLRSRKNRVYDLDTVLEFPCDLDIYFQHAIRVGIASAKNYSHTNHNSLIQLCYAFTQLATLFYI